MATDALAFMETLHTVGGEPHIDPLADQGIGDGIIMLIDFDMVVDVHGGFLPFGVFIGRRAVKAVTRVGPRRESDCDASRGVFGTRAD